MVRTAVERFFFEPDGARAWHLDDAMHAALADSLDHLAEAATDDLGSSAKPLAELSAEIRNGRRVPPLVFALYFQMADRLLTGDPAGARSVAGTLLDHPPRSSRLIIRRHGEVGASSLVAALNSETAGEKVPMADVAPETATAFSTLLDEAFDLLQRAVPDLHDEIRAIVHEILLAHAPAGALTEFDGASHYQFWGLLMLNPKHHRTRLAVAEVLAHEAAHSLLFGFTIDQPLVYNPDSELYPSPLRKDPRPMDGIFHATYVSARMAFAMERLACSGLLDDADRDAAFRAAAADRANFAAGLSVVDAHGRLSDVGRDALEGARAWISGSAS